MSEKAEVWKVVKEEAVADCRVFKVRRDWSVRKSDENEENPFAFFVIECPEWCNVIALTSEEKVVLIEQYRQGTQEITLEIPGGMIDDGENPEESAKRELLEETGYTAKTFISLGKTRPNPAIQDNWVHHFLALDCEKTQEVEFDSTEHVVTKLFELSEIPQLFAEEKITHSLVLACFQKFEIWKQNPERKL